MVRDAIQDQLIAARRNQILDAAAKVFAVKGFHLTTIKDIAREAGIADGTVYNYFENKTALLFGILDRMTEAALGEVDFTALAEMDLHTVMKTYLGHPLMALKADNFELFRVMMSEVMVNPELRTLYYRKILEPTFSMGEALFQEWSEQHAIKPTNIPLLTRVISGMMQGLILEYIIGDPVLEAQWDALPELLTDLILNGLKLDESKLDQLKDDSK